MIRVRFDDQRGGGEMSDDFEEMFAFVCGTAIRVFNEFGHHEPMLFVQTERAGEWATINLPWANPEQKEQAHRLMALAFARKPVNAYVFVSEAWAVKTTVGNFVEGSLEKHPERIEILTVYAADQRGARKTKVWCIERDEGFLRLVADEDMPGSQIESRLDAILLGQPAPNIELHERVKGGKN